MQFSIASNPLAHLEEIYKRSYPPKLPKEIHCNKHLIVAL